MNYYHVSLDLRSDQDRETLADSLEFLLDGYFDLETVYVTDCS